MNKKKTTIDKFLENFTYSNKDVDLSEYSQSIVAIKGVADKIPVDGEYDTAIISDRIGEYIHAIMECGKLLASLGLAEAYQKTEVDKIQATAALERAEIKGFTTAAERKLYAQMDDEFISAKNKLEELKAVIMYIDNLRASLNLAHLHCKKIIERNKTEERFANDHEKFGGESQSWINEKTLK